MLKACHASAESKPEQNKSSQTEQKKIVPQKSKLIGQVVKETLYSVHLLIVVLCSPTVGCCDIPTVVVEVAFSQAWKNLLQDVALYLTGTAGITRLVIAVKLDEGMDTSSLLLLVFQGLQILKL